MQPTSEQVRDFLVACGNDKDNAIAAIERFSVSPLARKKPNAMEGGSIALSIRDLKKTVDTKHGSQEILRNVNLDIYEGEAVAITGPSGSGKSSLLQILGTLDGASSGSISIFEQRVNTMSARQKTHFRSHTIGFIFQFFYLQPFLTVAENVELACMPARTTHKARRDRTREMLEAVGLADKASLYPRALSGGQIQRVAIARALYNKPRIVLADEPTGNLDSIMSQQIMDLLLSIRESYKTTIMIVTHDPAIASRADRQIVIRDGEVI